MSRTERILNILRQVCRKHKPRRLSCQTLCLYPRYKYLKCTAIGLRLEHNYGARLAYMNLLTKAASGERLTPQEAVRLYELPLFDLAAAADSVRCLRTDPAVVTYLIDRNINYSNVCNVGCAFCGFYRTRNQADAYTLSFEEISDKVQRVRSRRRNPHLDAGRRQSVLAVRVVLGPHAAPEGAPPRASASRRFHPKRSRAWRS